MQNRLRTTFLACVLLVAIAIQTLPIQRTRRDVRVAQQFSGGIRIYGLVNTPLDLSDADLSSMPTISEVAVLKCVWGAPSDLNASWTGIPMFHLLTLAGIKPEAVKVAFHARSPDDFSSALKVEDALKSSILFAVKANGVPLASLSEIAPGHIGGYRVVVPGRWGYKWVANVGSIEVVDYDYLGTYERPSSQGGLDQSDEAIVPNAQPTSIIPPLQAFDVPYGNRSFQVQVFTNASVGGFSFDLAQKSVDVNFTELSGMVGFADIILQQGMIAGPFETFLDGAPVSVMEANVSGLTFQHLTLTEGLHTLKIVGTQFLGDVPTIIIEPLPQSAYVGRELVFNASRSQDVGTIVTFVWDFGDGMLGTGSVVSHSYGKEGTFQVVVSAVDNFGGTSSKTFSVTVQKQPLDILLVLGLAFAAVTVIAVLVFVMLLLRRRKKDWRSDDRHTLTDD